MNELEQWAKELNSRHILFGIYRRQQAARRLASHASEGAARVLARAVVETTDPEVRSIALTALRCWRPELLQAGVLPVWRATQNTDLEVVLLQRGVVSLHDVELAKAAPRKPKISSAAQHASWLPAQINNKWDVLIQQAVDQEAWPLVWKMCHVVPAIQALPILKQLAASPFRPERNVSVYEQVRAAALACDELPRPTRWKVIRLLHHGVTTRGDAANFMQDGRRLVTSHADKILVWTVPDGDLVQRIEAPRDVSTLAIAPAQSIGWASLWYRHSITKVTFNPPSVEAMQFSADERVLSMVAAKDGKRLYCGDRLGKLYVGDTIRGGWTSKLTIGPDAIEHLSLSADGRWLAGGMRRKVSVWATPSMKRVFTLTIDRKIPHICMSPDGQFLAVSTGGIKPKVVVWDVPSGRIRWEADIVGWSNRLAVAPDSAVVVVASGKEIYWYQAVDGRVIDKMRVVTGLMAFHPTQPLWVTRNQGYDSWTQMWGESDLYRVLQMPLSNWSPRDMDAVVAEVEQPVVQTSDMLHSDRHKWVAYCRALSLLARHDDIEIVADNLLDESFDIDLED